MGCNNNGSPLPTILFEQETTWYPWSCPQTPLSHSLVNQVEFLGLVHTFVTVSPSNVPPNTLKQGMDTQIRNYRSRNLIGPYHFWGISSRNSTFFTRPFLVLWCARLGIRLWYPIDLAILTIEGCAFRSLWFLDVWGSMLNTSIVLPCQQGC